MGRLLAALIADSGTVPDANPANVANLDPAPLSIFADSQVSQGLQPARAAVTPSLNIFPHYKKVQEPLPASAAEQTARLLAAIRTAYRPDALIGAADAKPGELAALTDAGLAAYVSTLADDADRKAGRVPADVSARIARARAIHKAGRVPVGDTAAILCRACGPVWVHPSIAAVLPVVSGWPRALGCPWCFVPKVQGNVAIPRPQVTCGSCENFIPDTINPKGGAGRCKLGILPKRTPYQFTRQYCGSWRPREGTP